MTDEQIDMVLNELERVKVLYNVTQYFLFLRGGGYEAYQSCFKT